MSYGVVINYGSGDVNLRSYSGEDLVLQKGFSKTEDLYNKDFKPTINTAKFSILLNSTLSAALFALDNDDLITVTIIKDGSGWFKGYIRPVTGVTVNAGGGDTIDFECVDVGWILKEVPTSYAQKSTADSMTVYDGTSTANSIVHWILDEAGFTGTVSGDDIAESIDYMRLYSTDYFETLAEVLFAHHYTFYFDGDGNFHTYNWGPSSISAVGTLDEDDAIKTLKISRKDEDTNEVRVRSYDLNYTEDQVLASKVAGTWGDGFKLFDSDSDVWGPYELEAAPDEERQEWFANVEWRYRLAWTRSSPSANYARVYQWIYASSSDPHVAVTVTTDLDVTASYDGTIYSIQIDAVTLGTRTYAIGPVQVVGDVVTVSEGVEKMAGGGGNVKKFAPIYCYDPDWAVELAQAILKNLQLGTWRYKWRSQSDLSLGAYYTVTNTAANISSTCRIIKKVSTDNSNNDFYDYEAVGVGAIGTAIDTTSSGSTPAPLSQGEIVAAIQDAAISLEGPSEIVGPNLPSSTDNDPVATGLFVFSDRLGYYDATAEEWKAYIGNEGTFKFSGGGGSVEFDGTDFTVNADIALNGTVEAGDDIKSSNYSAGDSGWQITGNGDAEFNTLTVRRDDLQESLANETPADYAEYQAGCPWWLEVFKLDGSEETLNREPTTSVGAVYSTAQSKFYGSSLFASASGAAQESRTLRGGWTMDGSDTAGLCGWIYVTTVPGSSSSMAVAKMQSGPKYLTLSITEQNECQFKLYDETSIQTFTSTATFALNEWVFIAGYMSGGSAYTVVNGTAEEHTPAAIASVDFSGITAYAYATNGLATYVFYSSEIGFFLNGAGDDPYSILNTYRTGTSEWNTKYRPHAFNIASEVSSADGVYPPGFIYGLETEAATDSDHDVLIKIGSCRDRFNRLNLNLRDAITKQIDATWAAGDDTGGLFSGTVAADTTYHLFLIRKDSDSSIDAGWDTSVDCANIPAGYTAYRRIRSYQTDSSANIWYGFHTETNDYNETELIGTEKISATTYTLDSGQRFTDWDYVKAILSNTYNGYTITVDLSIKDWIELTNLRAGTRLGTHLATSSYTRASFISYVSATQVTLSGSSQILYRLYGYNMPYTG